MRKLLHPRASFTGHKPFILIPDAFASSLLLVIDRLRAFRFDDYCSIMGSIRRVKSSLTGRPILLLRLCMVQPYQANF
jgi:hypothetical protein